MAALATFDADGRWLGTLTDDAALRGRLQALGLGWGRWPLRASGDSAEDAAAAYASELQALRDSLHILSIDRVRIAPGRADWPALRRRFIEEHVHDDAEVRFFLDGSGLFHVRTGDGFAGLLCEAGEWVSLPAGLPHFFDAGEAPHFDALRLFTRADGWVAQPTGRTAPPQLPLFDEFVQRLRTLRAAVH